MARAKVERFAQSAPSRKGKCEGAAVVAAGYVWTSVRDGVLLVPRAVDVFL